jgi:23S rRNA (cytidine1920-2'-O)/16S rRNA (cytidine1409-2'-O)-methyltransferase
MSDKIRLDARIFELGLSESREKAKAFIMAGQVYVNGMKATKAGMTVSEKDSIEVRGGSEFVSRGGHKLKKAMSVFPINLENKICMDIGASTGGFTDCMLQNGAAKVFSVDVGYGQFAWKLRVDERVVCMERTNIRYVTTEDIGEKLDFASIDVSFISLRTILPAVKNLLKDNGEVVALIKPQFEAGRDKVGKKGVVRDKAVHKEVVSNIANYLIENDFNIIGMSFSPIKGPEGNREYLVYFSKDKEKESDFNLDKIDDIIEESHSQL